jgi:hypothetical protein
MDSGNDAFKIIFVQILLSNPFKMEKFNHKKKYHSNLGVFKEEIVFLFQMAANFRFGDSRSGSGDMSSKKFSDSKL